MARKKRCRLRLINEHSAMRNAVIWGGIIFFSALQLTVQFPDALWYTLGALLLGLAISVYLVSPRYVVRTWPAVFFGICSWAMLFFIDTEAKQQTFIAFSTVLFFASLWAFWRWREGLLSGMTKSVLSALNVACAFFFFSAFSAFLINFSPRTWIVVGMIGVMGIGVYALVHHFIFYVSGDATRATRYSAIALFFFLQLAWIVQFWPFGYLTVGALLLVFYYVLWDALESYAEGTFTRAHMITNLFVFFGLTGIVLLTTRWTLLG